MFNIRRYHDYLKDADDVKLGLLEYLDKLEVDMYLKKELPIFDDLIDILTIKAERDRVLGLAVSVREEETYVSVLVTGHYKDIDMYLDRKVILHRH